MEEAGTRVIRCGDTLWHGNRWQIARDHGPFDVAFLPVNGVIARFEGHEANVPVTLTPEQAVETAALGASTACSIHYALFDNPPAYVDQSGMAERFARAAQERGITPALVAAGGTVPLDH